MLSVLVFAVGFAGGSVPVSVDGEGYLRLALNGRIVYAKQLQLIADPAGIKDASGGTLIPLLKVPVGADFSVEADGTVMLQQNTARKVLGRIMVATFPADKLPKTEGNYAIGVTRPALSDPGTNGAGILVSGTQSAAPMTIARPNLSDASTLQIEIAETVEIDTPRMTLDAIANFNGHPMASHVGDIDFGTSPKAGVPYKLDSNRIKARLKLKGLKETDFRLIAPQVITILTKGQTVEPQMFIEAAIDAAQARFGADSQFKAEGDPGSLKAPMGSLELRAETSRVLQDRFIVTIAAFVDGRRINSKSVTLIGSGLGYAVKQSSLVKVMLTANQIAIELTGKAKGNARIGEAVQVEVQVTPDSPATLLTGTVTAPNTVEVKG